MRSADNELYELLKYGERMDVETPGEELPEDAAPPEHGPDFMAAQREEDDARYEELRLGPTTEATTEGAAYGRGTTAPRILCRTMTVTELLED